MPDCNGRIPPVSLHGVKNAWLDSLERKPYEGPVMTRVKFIAKIAAETDVPIEYLLGPDMSGALGG